MISEGHSKLSITKQCELLDINRSVYYYTSKPESKLNLKLMRLMDEHYLHHPFKGAERMHTWLTLDKGYKVNKKRIERLYYRVMGLSAIVPSKTTSRRCKAHKVYPYLLRNLSITKQNQVWATDISYIPMRKGFMYLTAVIDLYSRYVVGWSVSNTMDAYWCKETLQEAIEKYGKPEIINTDQGSQYTSEVFSHYVLNNGIRLSMDGKGRAIDNVFIERLWKSVKYESIYLNPPENGFDLNEQLKSYFYFYNNERRHKGIANQLPVEVFNKLLKIVA